MGCRIRQWRFEDKEALAAIIGNKKVQDNLRDGIPYPYSVKDAEEFISQMLSSDGTEVFAFAIEAEGSLAGSIGVYRCANVHHRTGELGYYLGENCWGRGYAAEAIRQVCDHVFENSDILRIFAEPFSRNRASCRVLEKAGFRHEGTLRENAVKNGKLEDMEMYSLLRKEWEKGKPDAGAMENCKASAQTPPCPEKPVMPEGYLGGYNRGWWDVAAPNRRLISRYNSMDPEKLWDKYLLLKELLGSVDEKAIIEAPFRCDNGKNIFLGKQFYANYGLVILDAAPVTFGDNVIVGPNAMFCAASHPIHPDCRFHNGDFPILSAPITVGDNVWIGGGVIVLPGVTIGSGSVIGAGSVVTRDIPPMSVAAGSPCRVLRKINENDRYVWPEDIV